MNELKIAPVLVGRGMAGQAILKSLSIISQMESDLCLLPVRLVQRGNPLGSYLTDHALNILFIANPSGLHAKCILEGCRAGYAAMAVDKPVCVRPDEITALQAIPTPMAVYHGYRAMWGTRTIKEMIDAGQLGEVFSFEARYWQSSSAQARLSGMPEKRAWKNDALLNGPCDTLTDLGSHVVDLCLHLMADTPVETQRWVSYQNAPAPHRDTHVHLMMEFAGTRRALASISKTAHGATNQLEYTVMGTQSSATWRFLHPDEIELGSGSCTSILRRQNPCASSGSSPFHGLGWLEGYVEITRQILRRAAGLDSVPVPTLQESLATMSVLLGA